MRKVVKFGGSSLANAAQFKKVGEIIRADQTRRYVVPSARENGILMTRKSQTCSTTAMNWQRKERNFFHC